MAEIGFLGLGAMGKAIAGRLIAAGHTVTVWNRSTAASEELVSLGAIQAESPADALSKSVSFSMLADDNAVQEVLNADSLGNHPSGRIHVCMASISPEAADQLGERLTAAGITLVSSPVLGRPAVAQEGKLNILAAGPADAVSVVEPFLLNCGVKVWNFGESPRLANVVKISVNFTILHALQAMGESITLVESQGVDATEFVELLTGTLFSAPIYSIYGNIIAEKKYTPPGFTMPLGLKDLRLAEGLAAEKGISLPSSPVLHKLFDIALADSELAELDWSAVAEVTRQQKHERLS